MPNIQRQAEGPGCNPGDQVVGEEREQDAENDIELHDPHEPAAEAGRRDLGDVHRRDHRRPAHREAAQETEGQERIPAPGRSRMPTADTK